MKASRKHLGRELLSRGVFAALTLLSICGGGIRVALGQSNAPTPIDPDTPPKSLVGDSPDAIQNDPINSLAYVNSNADSVSYADRIHGPFSAALELRGNYADNVFDASNNRQSGAFFVAGAPVGYVFTGERNRFSANYRIDGDVYPGYSSLNSFSQVYLQRLEHSTSEVTNYFWDLTAGRVTSLGQYLPALVPIGSTGIVQTNIGSSVLQNSYLVTNAVTVAGVNHKLDARNTFNGTATGGWLEEAQQSPDPGAARQVLRSEPFGVDLRFDHLVTPTSAVGAELTNLYVRGLAPAGHEDYTAVEATYRYNFNTYLGARVAAGPLFNLSGSHNLPVSSTLTYALSGAVDYNTMFARIAVDYSRVIELQYLQAPTVAHQVSAVFDRAVSKNVDLTVDARLVHAASNAFVPSQTNYGVTARVDRYLSSNLSFFIMAARFALSIPPTSGTPIAYSRDQISGGIHYSFGAPLERQGPRQ